MVAEAVTPAQNSTQRKMRALRALARVAAYCAERKASAVADINNIVKKVLD